MSDEQDWIYEIRSSINETIQNIIKDEVQKTALNVVKLTDSISNCSDVRKSINDMVHSRVATEIGNRLRLGLYDGALMDKAFQKVWDDQFQKALEDRIVKKANEIAEKAVKDRIKEFLK